MVVTVEAGAVTVTVTVGLFGAAAARIARLENTIALENIILSMNWMLGVGSSE
jgi:hypothetical protein